MFSRSILSRADAPVTFIFDLASKLSPSIWRYFRIALICLFRFSITSRPLTNIQMTGRISVYWLKTAISRFDYMAEMLWLPTNEDSYSVLHWKQITISEISSSISRLLNNDGPLRFISESVLNKPSLHFAAEAARLFINNFRRRGAIWILSQMIK